MAFPIPSHLPRKSNNVQDVSSKILSKLDEATNQTLNAAMTTSWIIELDETILLTKNRIHERIHASLPDFERQMHSSKSVQTRLQALSNDVDNLSQDLSHPETGLIPTLVNALTAHASLAQASTDAAVAYELLSHILRCKGEFASIASLVPAGSLPDAVKACERLESLLDNGPALLNQINVVVDLKRKFRATKDFIEEQLNDAYSRSVIITPTNITLQRCVQIRQSEATISLPAIFTSLSTTSISSHLVALRRDLTTHYIDNLFRQSTSSATIAPSTQTTEVLSLVPAPPEVENLSTRLHNMSLVLTFLNTHLFPFLPNTQRDAFPRSLCKPVTTALLQHLLIPALPSSYHLLPQFLDLVRNAVEFEEEYVAQMLDKSANDRTIKAWADAVCVHYEKKRRQDILESLRLIIIRADEDSSTFRAEVVPEPASIVVQAESSPTDDRSWGFDSDEIVDGESSTTEESGWGFDDIEPEVDEVPQPQPLQDPLLDEEDPASAWGWNDEDDLVMDDNADGTAWDDPWNEKPASATSDARPQAAPTISSTHPPKAAAGLEKFSSKNKKAQSNGSLANSPQAAAENSIITAPIKPVYKTPTNPPRPIVPKEDFLVSDYIKSVVRIVENVLREGKELSSSTIMILSPESTSSPGSVILQTASSVLDLFRALYPVKFGSALASPERSMRFSNDCLYLSGEIDRIAKTESGEAMEKLAECQGHLKILGDSWFYHSIETQCESVDEALVEAEGFTETSEQDRYDECESAITRVQRQIRLLAQRWKGVLPKSKYYTAVGLVVDAALSHISRSILALPDITEEESHKLSELCRILNSLEGLFVEDTIESSFVVAYVPSWLKFSYLSELLEASIADISYLFEEGALVDFQVDELVKLVRALFADTPLRTSTINKLLGGHV